MKSKLKLFAAWLLLSTINYPLSTALAQGTAFTYQGRLNNGGSPANGLYDFEFSLSNGPSGGSQVGASVTNLAVGVTNGLFTTGLDFGAVFAGNPTWLAISVRTNGMGGYLGLHPLQPLTPTPYAVFAANAGKAASANSVSAANLVGTIPATQLPASVITNGEGGVNLAGAFTGNGGGLSNVPGTMTQVVAASTNFTAQANTAYDLTNSAAVSVTLPANANVGDVIQVTGTGAGGWQVTKSGFLVCTEQMSAPTSAEWQAVASSSDGTHLVAVVAGGGIYTSANSGVTWTQQTSAPTSANWEGVASSADGTHLVVVAYEGGIYTSANSGVTWTQQTSAPTSADWQAVAASADGTHLIAAVVGGGIYTSANSGVTWTQQTSAPTSAAWYGVAASADGTHLVAVADGGGIYTSANSGVTWTQQTSAQTSAGWLGVASSADGTHLVAVSADVGIYTSANSGVTWTQQTSAQTSADWQGVASSADGTHLVAVAADVGIYTSANSGVTWTQQTSAQTSADWQGVASSADGTHLVAVVNGGGIYTLLADDITGTAGTSEQFQYLGNGVWQPLPPTAGYLANNGTTVLSPGNGSGLSNVPGTLAQLVTASTNFTAQANTAYDLTNSAPVSVTLPANANVGDVIQVTGTGGGGWQVTENSIVAWTELTGAPNSGEWIAVASSTNGTQLVALASPGGIYTSADSGVTWTQPTSAPTSASWSAVASSADGTQLVAVVGGGGIYTSANSGVTWALQASAPTSAGWSAVAASADGTHLVAVAWPGGIYTSANSGINWTERMSAPTSATWAGVASSADGTHLVAVAADVGIYTSANSGVTWTEQTSAPTLAYWSGVASSADGTHLVAVAADVGIYTSADSGVTWTAQTGAPTSASWQAVASSADGTHLVAVAYDGGIYISANSGVTWTQPTSTPTSADWLGVASSSDGTHLVAAVNGGGIYTSLDGVTGAPGTSEQFQYFGNGFWQPLPPTAGYLSTDGSTVLGFNTLVVNGESGVTLSGTFIGNGIGLTFLNAPSLTGSVPAASLTSVPAASLTGTIPNGLLSTNVALRAGGNAFTGNQTITNGYLGIGLANPAYPLEVASGGAAKMTLDSSGNLECSGTVYSHGIALTSDRNLKEHFAALDGQAVLAKVAALPLSEWNYKSDSPAVQHIGPMAQDFHTAFGLDGTDDKHISVVDEGGVALAAIQGLNQKLEAESQAKYAEIQTLKQQNESLVERLNELEATVKQLAEKK